MHPPVRAFRFPPSRASRHERCSPPVVARKANPALLTNADYYGTLAAARSLGRYGVPVTVAHDNHLGAASWSRFVSRSLSCPPTSDSRRFLEWLVAFGATAPGHVLYPTSDDAAFIYAAHREELAKYFHLYQPPVEAIYGLLNKRKLGAEARAVGLQAPRTWFPKTDADFEQIRDEARGSLVIKPVTQILFTRHRKGEVVLDASTLKAQYESFADEPYAAELVERDPDVASPMVQEFHPEAGHAIYSLSGFITQKGEWAMRGAMKVLQLPRRLGVGICFENAPVEGALADAIVSMCQRMGYFGVFEAEFIRHTTGLLLIDFNPRFYGQMGFDIARGLPLVALAYEGAMQNHERVTQLMRSACEWSTANEVPPVFCNQMALNLVLRSQQSSGAMPAAEAHHWREWIRTNATVDAVFDDEDWAPSAVDLLSRLSAYARHPRSFVRTVVLNR
jgi:D-aspartate ligase